MATNANQSRPLIDSFQAVRGLTETLAAPLGPEDQTAQSMPDVSPTKWHRAHTTWFFETFILEQFERSFTPVNPQYRVMFNSYYNGVGDQYPRAERGSVTRPGASEVADYRRQVDKRVVEVVADNGDNAKLAELLELGLHHEQQHQELLLMDIKHVLSRNPLEPVYTPQAAPTRRADDRLNWLAVDGGEATIGHSGTSFSFDNEGPQHQVLLDDFEIADRLVTAGEWAAFIDDGGYERPDLWLSDGWHTLQARSWDAPLYWHRSGDGWRVHTLGGTRPVEPTEPVCHVSYYEADAYARWAGARLATEFEWEHAVSCLESASRAFDISNLHPCSADPAPGQLRQASGEVWQWTASAYLPYPRFAPAPGAVGEYNGKFMSGQMVLRGGSALTPPDHSRPSYRNFFPPDARWPMTGVRLARYRES